MQNKTIKKEPSESSENNDSINTKNLNFFNEFIKDSEITLEDAEELGRKVNKSLSNNYNLD